MQLRLCWQPAPACCALTLRRLYRDSTQYVHGKHVRDLSKLNRDMRQVLFVTADSDAYALQPENAIKVRACALHRHQRLQQAVGPRRGQGPMPRAVWQLWCSAVPVLQLSKEWKEGDTLLLDLLPFLEAVVRTQASKPCCRLPCWLRSKHAQSPLLPCFPLLLPRLCAPGRHVAALRTHAHTHPCLTA
jgi:hypothetical protein